MARGGPDYSNIIEGGYINVPTVAHASQHQDGGIDEILVEGLSGRLADYQSADRIYAGLDANKPASPTTGDIFFATDTGKLYVWDGSAWNYLRYAKGLRAGLAANIPASGDFDGDCYFETDTGTLRIWDGTVWQEIGAVPAGVVILDKARAGILALDAPHPDRGWTLTTTAPGTVSGTIYSYILSNNTDAGSGVELAIDARLFRLYAGNRVLFNLRLIDTTSAIAVNVGLAYNLGKDVGARSPDANNSRCMFYWNGSSWKTVTNAAGGAALINDIGTFTQGRFEIYTPDANTVQFIVDGEIKQTHTTNLPDQLMKPFVSLVSLSASLGRVQVFSFYAENKEF